MAPDAWTPDRRRGDRHLLAWLLPARVEGTDESLAVRELSMGGMVMEAATPMQVGVPLRVTLGSGTDVVGPIEGHVVHSRLMLGRHVDVPVCLVGVAFRHVTPSQAERIAAWLSATNPHGTHSIRVP